MKSFEKYDIPFVGLKLGLHIFTYKLSGDLLSLYEESPVKKCDIDVNLEFLKREGVFELGFNLSGTVDTDCDRCNDLLQLPIEDRFKILVKFKSVRHTESEDEDPDILFLEKNDTHINVAKLLYEFLILSMPIYKVHQNDENGQTTCNPAVMQWLEGEEDEAEKPNEENEDFNDPRWEALRSLKNKK